MALTKEITEDKIEVVGLYKAVQVRTATVVKEDGVELNRSFSRRVISAGDDYSGESTEVQGICAIVHTSEVVASYVAYLASQAEED